MKKNYNENVQLDIFSASLPSFKLDKNKKLRTIELFAGYGSQLMAWKRLLGDRVEHFKITEWATPSIEAYNDIHIKDFTDYSKDKSKEELVIILAEKGISVDYNKPMTFDEIKRKPEAWIRRTYNNIIATNNTVDVTRTHGSDFYMEDRTKYNVFFSYSFPCQDISLAGKLAGFAPDSGTRSSMLWQVMRILKELKDIGDEQLPDVLMCENVPGLVSEKTMGQFNTFLNILESLGYNSFYKILEATDYGIPQTRKRVFVVSVKNQYSFEFAKAFPLKKRLKDLLEKNVAPKYYLTQDQIDKIKNWNSQRNPLEASQVKGDIAHTVTAKSNTSMNASMLLLKEHQINEVNEVGSYTPSGRSGKIVSSSSSSSSSSAPTITTGNHGKQIATLVAKEVSNTIRCGGRDTYDGKHLWNFVAKEKEGSLSIDVPNGNDKVHQKDKAYDENGSIRGLLATDYKQPPMVITQDDSTPYVVGGIGEKKSNGGTQLYMQDRIYDGQVVVSVATGFNPNYLVKEDEEQSEEGIKFPEATKQGYAIAKDGDGVYIAHLTGKRGTVQKGKAQTIKTSQLVGVVVKDDEEVSDGGNKVIVVGNVNGHQSGVIFHEEGCSPTVSAHTHGNTRECVMVKEHGRKDNSN